MWSSIHLSILPVWGDCQYAVTATWREDGETEPVTLTRIGVAHVHPENDPVQFLIEVVAELQAHVDELRRAP